MSPILLGLAVVECSPAAGEDGESAFADAAQAAEESVVGAVVHVEDLVTGGLFDRGVHADACALVAAIGERGQVELGCGPVQGTEDVLAGHGQVVHGAGFDVGHPSRETVWSGECLDVAAGLVGFSGVPQVDLFSFDTKGFLATAVSGEDLPVEDHIREPVGLGLLQGFMQIWRLVGEHIDDLVEVAISGGAGNSVIPSQRGDLGVLAEPAQPQHRLPKACQRPAVLAGTAPAAFGIQQPADVLGEFTWHVEHGTIGNHGEPLTLDLIFANPVLPGAPRPRLTGSHQQQSRPSQCRALHTRDDLGEITSLGASGMSAAGRPLCSAVIGRTEVRRVKAELILTVRNGFPCVRPADEVLYLELVVCRG